MDMTQKLFLSNSKSLAKDQELTLLLLCNKNNNKNPHLNFLKGTVIGDKEQGVGIRDKGQRIRDKT